MLNLQGIYNICIPDKNPGSPGFPPFFYSLVSEVHHYLSRGCLSSAKRKFTSFKMVVDLKIQTESHLGQRPSPLSSHDLFQWLIGPW